MIIQYTMFKILRSKFHWRVKIRLQWDPQENIVFKRIIHNVVNASS